MNNKLIYIAAGVILVIGALFFLIPAKEKNKEGATMTETIATTTAKKATIVTEKGDIVLELYPDDAPKTVTNFVELAKKGYYDGLTFHRVEIGIVQTGDPNGNGTGGTSIYGDTFEDELDPGTASYQRGYVEGVVAMANRGPNTNGSQFFINQVDNTTKFNKAYTIFGRVTSGMDIVKNLQVGDKITTITVEE